MTRFRRPHGWLQWVAVAVGVLVIAAGIAAVVILTGSPGDVSHPNVEFTAPPTTTAQQPAPSKKARPPAVNWPLYGYDRQRTRYFPIARPPRPPYRQVWNYRAGALLEFPPVGSAQSLFVLKDDGMLVAVGRSSGHVRWGRKLGYLAASSPAVGGGSVYAVILQRTAKVRQGRVVALNGGSGRTRWSVKLGSRAESSPLLDRGTLYFGTENGTVYALRASDGSVRWTYRASGAVKGGIAMDYRGRLFFGDYSGHVYSLRSSDGHQLWRVGTNGAHYGLASGQFYATAAVAYGRVYLGNTDGFMYSFASSSGKLAWRTHTGGYVYGSAAVADVPRGRPAVYFGSYDRRFYALDAQSGHQLWSRDAGGRVSGGAVLVGDMVWFSTLEQQTRALNARNGALLYKVNRGQFNPVIGDSQNIYLVGHSTLTALQPINRRALARARARAKARRAQAQAKARQRARARARARAKAKAKARARAKARRRRRP